MLLRIGHSRAVYEVNLNSSTSVSGTNVGVDGRKVTESETILPASATKMVCILFSTILVWFLSVTWALQSPTLTKKRQLCRGRRLKMVDNKRLLNKAEYDMNNYEARGGCYPPRRETKWTTPLEICLILGHMKAEINNCFIIYSKYFEGLSSILTSK